MGEYTIQNTTWPAGWWLSIIANRQARMLNATVLSGNAMSVSSSWALLRGMLLPGHHCRSFFQVLHDWYWPFQWNEWKGVRIWQAQCVVQQLHMDHSAGSLSYGTSADMARILEKSPGKRLLSNRGINSIYCIIHHFVTLLESLSLRVHALKKLSRWFSHPWLLSRVPRISYVRNLCDPGSTTTV